ncbi:hypothetical protein LJC10_00625 [Selenomonadales bacterium OttesenSCG-928-I06]|nr:hypothetical protein [Selenomonadales bacterium OttesenSCG-928-I06]
MIKCPHCGYIPKLAVKEEFELTKLKIYHHAYHDCKKCKKIYKIVKISVFRTLKIEN